ncbi:MAG: hypothetical protein RJA61_503 [Candidatus Parcubacteria bacterium]|jgi:hypothetical protein
MKPNDVLFIIFIVGIGLAALLSGGAKGAQNGTRGSFFLNGGNDGKPLTENQIEQEIKKVERSVQEIAKDIQELEENKNASVYKGQITMRISGQASRDPATEYITLETSTQNKNPIRITGFQFKSLSTNKGATIGQAIPLFFSQGNNVNQDVYLKPGERAYVVTGKGSMNNISFQVNKCFGYHNQFNTFMPSIQQQCPLARDEKNNIPTSPVNDSCFDFIESFPQCKTQTTPLPTNFTFECRNFILETMNYNSCVNLHKNESGFYSKEWRVFLGRDESLWKSRREAIVLLDQDGKTIDTVIFD